MYRYTHMHTIFFCRYIKTITQIHTSTSTHTQKTIHIHVDNIFSYILNISHTPTQPHLLDTHGVLMIKKTWSMTSWRERISVVSGRRCQAFVKHLKYEYMHIWRQVVQCAWVGVGVGVPLSLSVSLSLSVAVFLSLSLALSLARSLAHSLCARANTFMYKNKIQYNGPSDEILEDLRVESMSPSATSVWGLAILVYEALTHKCMRIFSPLKLLLYAALSY
jgi:hypothetical protein